jgi:D-lactate dehydrogenase
MFMLIWPMLVKAQLTRGTFYSIGYGINSIASKAKELGIRVARVPAYSPYAIAEHTVALMLAVNRKLISANNPIRELNFSLNGLVGFDMNGKTVGIAGTGKIGAVLTRIMYAFGCKLLAYDQYENKDLCEEAVFKKHDTKPISL